MTARAVATDVDGRFRQSFLDQSAGNGAGKVDVVTSPLPASHRLRKRGGHFGSDLETTGTDGRSDPGRHIGRCATRLQKKLAQGVRHNAPSGAPPAGMNGRHAPGSGQQDRNAIGHSNDQAKVVTGGHQAVGLAGESLLLNSDDVAPMNLLHVGGGGVVPRRAPGRRPDVAPRQSGTYPRHSTPAQRPTTMLHGESLTDVGHA